MSKFNIYAMDSSSKLNVKETSLSITASQICGIFYKYQENQKLIAIEDSSTENSFALISGTKVLSIEIDEISAKKWSPKHSEAATCIKQLDASRTKKLFYIDAIEKLTSKLSNKKECKPLMTYCQKLKEKYNSLDLYEILFKDMVAKEYCIEVI